MRFGAFRGATSATCRLLTASRSRSTTGVMMELKPEHLQRWEKPGLKHLEIRPSMATSIYKPDGVKGKDWLRCKVLDEKESVETVAAASRDPSFPPAVRRFLSLSVRTGEEPYSNEELSATLKDLEELLEGDHHRTLKLDQLRALVLALASWPLAMMTSSDDSPLFKLVKRLEAASYDRIYLFEFPDVEQKSSIYLSSCPDRLELAKAWVHALGRDGRSLPVRSFPNGLLNKSYSRTGTSGMFRALTPRMFLDLVLIMNNLNNVGVKFNRYYALYKFFEFVHFYDVNAIAAVCRTFNKFEIYLGPSHPIARTLTGIIVERMTDETEAFDDSNLFHLSVYLRRMGFASTEAMRPIHDAVAEGRNRLQLSTLLALGSVTGSSESQTFISLTKAMLEPDAFDAQRLSVNELLSVMELVERGFWPLSDDQKHDVILSVAGYFSSHIEHGRLSVFLRLLYHMLANGVFDDRVVERVLRDPRLVYPSSNGKLAVAKKIVFDLHHSESKLLRRIFTTVHGLLLLNHPRGPELLDFLCPKSVRMCYEWLDLPLPSRTDIDYGEGSLFLQVGSDVHSVLKEFVRDRQPVPDDVASTYVLETCLLPFLGTLEYLMTFDRRSGCFVPVPERIRNLPLEAIKLPSSDPNLEWMVVAVVHKQKHLVYDLSPESAPEDHVHVVQLEKVGYKVVSIVDATKHKLFCGTVVELVALLRSELRICIEKHLSGNRQIEP